MKPDSVVINVRYYGGAYIAKAVGMRAQASHTGAKDEAVQHVAEKIYGKDGFTLQRYGEADTWIAKIKEAQS